jgi:hypothetical protein
MIALTVPQDTQEEGPPSMVHPMVLPAMAWGSLRCQWQLSGAEVFHVLQGGAVLPQGQPGQPGAQAQGPAYVPMPPGPVSSVRHPCVATD